jgi:hypothetical protein
MFRSVRLTVARVAQSRAILALLLLAACPAGSALAQGTAAAQDDPLPWDRRPEVLNPRDHPLISQPEWLAMVVDLAATGRFAPRRGWFGDGKASTRYTWDAVAARLDRDHDGSISPAEFGGTEADFRRLDRVRDRKLTAADWEFPANALARSRSKMVMSFADDNGDGRIDRMEFNRMSFLASRDTLTHHHYFADALDDITEVYGESESRRLPFLSIADLRDTIDRAAREKYHRAIPSPDADVDTASRATLFRALIQRDLGVLRQGPDDGRDRVTLSKRLGTKPVVLIFGCLTELGFRYEAGTLEKLYRRYQDRAEFLFVYTRESRPKDGWSLPSTAKPRVVFPQPKDDRARARVAQECRRQLGLTMPIVVDGVDDRVGILYSGMPDRLYLLDARGQVAFRGARGPFGFRPDELEQSLLLLLQAEPGDSAKSAALRAR